MKKGARVIPFLIPFFTIVIGISAYLCRGFSLEDEESKEKELKVLQTLKLAGEKICSFFGYMELKSIDLRFRFRGSKETFVAGNPKSEVVVMAVIDEKSLAKEGKWPWPRSKLADLIKKLSKAGAKVIAFDIGFLEPDEYHEKIADTLEDVEDEIRRVGAQSIEIHDYLQKLKEKADHDSILADAIENSKAKVILGYFFHTEDRRPSHMTGKDIYGSEFQTDTLEKDRRPSHMTGKDIKDRIRTSEYKVAFTLPKPPDQAEKPAFSEGKPSPPEKPTVCQASTAQPNIRVISDAASYSGFFNISPDADGVVRWSPGVIQFDGKPYAPLSLMAASLYLNASLQIKMNEYKVEWLRIGDLNIPVNEESGELLINYRGKEKTFRHIPITDILNGGVPDKELQDKMVLVGATAIGLYDMRATPLEIVFPGIEIHANIIDSILSGDFLDQPGWIFFFDMMVIFAAGGILGFVLPRVGIALGSASTLLLLICHIILCQHMFSDKNLVISAVYPILVIILTYIGMVAYKYLTESKQKQFIKGAFSTYLAPSVVDHLIKNPGTLILGGEEREISAFFSDVQGFTSISEKLAPKELVELLNEFLTEMTDIILQHSGTVDKFEGDAIIAFFGAPQKIGNQAELACRACIDMQNRLAELRKSWKEKGKPELWMRIGLYTGQAVVGNMGSRTRMDYTMMGDTVNTAARLEGVNKVYGIYTLIGETTREQAGDEFVTREIDSIHLVGKREPVTIYELLGYPEDVDDITAEANHRYASGLAAYRKQEWTSAMLFFEAALDIAPADGPAKAMLARCEELRANPPGKEWDGVFTLKTK